MFKQQKNAGRIIAYLVLSTTKWQVLKGSAALMAAAIDRAVAGGYEYLQLGPLPRRPSAADTLER